MTHGSPGFLRWWTGPSPTNEMPSVDLFAYEKKSSCTGKIVEVHILMKTGFSKLYACVLFWNTLKSMTGMSILRFTSHPNFRKSETNEKASLCFPVPGPLLPLVFFFFPVSLFPCSCIWHPRFSALGDFLKESFIECGKQLWPVAKRQETNLSVILEMCSWVGKMTLLCCSVSASSPKEMLAEGRLPWNLKIPHLPKCAQPYHKRGRGAPCTSQVT